MLTSSSKSSGPLLKLANLSTCATGLVCLCSLHLQHANLKADELEDFTTFDIIGDMAFGEPFGCLKDGVFHSWVSLITQTIKAGAYEQATRRMFKSGGFMQKFLCKFIPSDLREKRYRHLELSREKCLK